MKRNIITSIFVSVVLSIAGCEACHEEADTPVIRPSEYEYMLVFALDSSPSFKNELLENDAAAYRFFTGTLEKYMRDRGNPDDRVLITGLCDEECPLLWQGKPRDLLRQFNKPGALKQFLMQQSKPTKNAYGSLATTLDYVCDLPPVRSGKAKACVIVLSNMRDSSSTSDEDIAKMAAALKRFSGVRSEIGFWWIDLAAVKTCQKCFRDAGLPEPMFEPMERKPDPLDFSGTN